MFSSFITKFFAATKPSADKHILLDLDGTLFNFIGRCCEILHLDEQKILENWPVGDWSIENGLKISTEQLWDAVDDVGEAFWAEMKPYAWADELYGYCESVCPTYILTKPTLHPCSLSGKIRCLYRWRGKNYSNYVLTPHKELCSISGSLLIDDCETNVDKFVKGAGHAILFPAHTNCRYREADRCLEMMTSEIYEWLKL